MLRKIQIFGERCSGTNYLECLLNRNYPFIEISREFGCKHFFCLPGADDAEDHLFAVIYRNPFDWLSSLHRTPHHAAPPLWNLPFSEFIRKEWWCVYDESSGQPPGHPKYRKEMMHERSPETGERFSNIMKMRMAKILDWTSLGEKAKNVCYIRYEDLIDHPAEFISRLSTSYGMRNRKQFRAVDTYKGLPNAVYKPATYDPIDPADKAYIIDELDPNIERSIGYDLSCDHAQDSAPEAEKNWHLPAPRIAARRKR